jgi:integrase
VCRISLDRRVGRLVHATDANGQSIWRRDLSSLGLAITGKTEAEAEASRLEAAIRAGDFETDRPKLPTLTLRQLVTRYTDDKKPARPQDSLDVLYRTPLARLAGGELAFGDWLIADITTDTIERFQEIRSRRTLMTRKGQLVPRPAGGRVAANRHLAFLRIVFNWAVRKDYLTRTPFKHNTEPVIKLAKELPRRRRLESGEEVRLFAECAPYVRLVVEALLETGCRIGELLSLQWSQVRFAPKAVLELSAAKTKTKKDRIVPISPRLRAILEMLKTDPSGADHLADHYVFGTITGQRIQSIDNAWTAARRRAGIADLHLHDLRREAASRWLERGVALNVIQALLGHAKLSQTSTYLGVSEAGFKKRCKKSGSQIRLHLVPEHATTNGPQTAPTRDRRPRKTLKKRRSATTVSEIVVWTVRFRPSPPFKQHKTKPLEESTSVRQTFG